MAVKHSIAQAKYDKSHCKYYSIKLNLISDADIISKLADVESMQGYIKQLIRDDITSARSAPTVPVPKKTMSINDLYVWLQKYADANYDGSLYDVINALSSKLMGYEIDG